VSPGRLTNVSDHSIKHDSTVVSISSTVFINYGITSH